MSIQKRTNRQKAGCVAVFALLLTLFCANSLPATEQTAPQTVAIQAPLPPASEPVLQTGGGQTAVSETATHTDTQFHGPPDIQRIIQRGHLIVAMYHQDTPPFYYRDSDGKMNGIDVRLVEGFARQLGVGIHFERSAKTFKEVVDQVSVHQADLAISKLGMTFARAMRIRYSQPYIQLRQALLVNRLLLAKRSVGGDRTEIIKNLDGKLGVIALSSYVDNAKERFKKATIVEFDNWKQVVKAAERGDVIAAYRDEVEVKMIMRDQPHTALRLLTVVLADTKDPKAIITAWNSPNLLALVNFYLENLDLNLTGDMILNNYDAVIQKINTKIKDAIH